MTIRFTAVVEHGLLRPIEPILFPEGATVELIVAPPSTMPNGRSAAEVLAQIAALPMEPGGREFSGRDHDKILYGERGAR